MAAGLLSEGYLKSREIKASKDLKQKNPSDLVTVGKH